MKPILLLSLFVSAQVSFAKEPSFTVSYFSRHSYEADQIRDHHFTSGRNVIDENDSNWLLPVLVHFPKAVFTLDQMFYRSDDNCTHSPNKILGVETWESCRRHDYCFAELANYSQFSNFRESFHHCNQELKSNIEKECRLKHRAATCDGMKELYYLGVNTLPLLFRTYISTQNKQALFLSEIIRTKNEKMLQFMNVDEIKKRLNSFCKLSSEYMGQKHRNSKWLTYSDSDHDDLPYVEFQPCEEFEGMMMPKAI